MGAYEIIFMM